MSDQFFNREQSIRIFIFLGCLLSVYVTWALISGGVLTYSAPMIVNREYTFYVTRATAPLEYWIFIMIWGTFAAAFWYKGIKRMREKE